ncbi:MAG: NfeD family protein [Kiritimatiellaceae bacterium]|nr:NfeD family protein [Kiritimatiellaceae bacterium]
MFSPAFWWAVVGVGLMLCEFIVPGLILFFFGLGALVTALLVLLIPMSLTVQLILFTVASLVSLFGLRRFLKPIFTGSSIAADGSLSEGMVGQEAKVTRAIAPGASGKVLLNGTAWKAESEESLKEDQVVVVDAQKSLTLIVKSK